MAFSSRTLNIIIVTATILSILAVCIVGTQYFIAAEMQTKNEPRARQLLDKVAANYRNMTQYRSLGATVHADLSSNLFSNAVKGRSGNFEINFNRNGDSEIHFKVFPKSRKHSALWWQLLRQTPEQIIKNDKSSLQEPEVVGVLFDKDNKSNLKTTMIGKPDTFQEFERRDDGMHALNSKLETLNFSADLLLTTRADPFLFRELEKLKMSECHGSRFDNNCVVIEGNWMVLPDSKRRIYLDKEKLVILRMETTYEIDLTLTDYRVEEYYDIQFSLENN